MNAPAKILLSVVTFITLMFLLWYGGVDFLERGFRPAYLTFCGIVFGGIVYWAAGALSNQK